MACKHTGPLRLLRDEDENTGIQCPGCGMYAFAAGPHRHSFLGSLVYSARFALGQRPPLPTGVRGVGWEKKQSSQS